jgi:V/A-type H+-transporting ATPase subunit C
MSNNTGSRALTVKFHAMYGRCLTKQNYSDLVRKQSVSEVVSYLKQETDYWSVLRDVNENLVHRGQIEIILRRVPFDQYMKIFNYISKKEFQFYKFVISRMEMDEVLNCIRLINAGRNEDYIFTLPSFFAKHAGFDLYSLAKVKNFDDLLNLLKPTPYYEVLKNYDPSEGEKIDIIRIEIEFNKLYYTKILDVIDHTFSGKVREQIRNSVGMQIDLNNISDIIRLKKYFNANRDYISKLLLPFYFNVKLSELQEIMDAPDADAAWKAACKTYYGNEFKKFDFEYVENYKDQIMYNFHKKLFVFTTSAPVAVTSYLNMKKTEIQNLIHIIEGIRYGLAPVQISKLLVGVEN